MVSTSHVVPIGIGGESVPEGIHLCHIYSDDGERGRTMARFVGQGLAERARVLCLLDAVTPCDIRGYLEGLGVDLAGKEEALVTGPSEDTYRPSGSFMPDELLGNLSTFCQKSVAEGYSGVRITGDMAWVLRRQTDMASVMEYEVKASEHCRVQPVVALCEYDARRFDGRTIMDILSVHPAIIVRGQIVKNPYYVEPREFLARYRAGAGETTGA